MSVGLLFGAFHVSFAGGCDGRLDETVLVRNPDSKFPCDAIYLHTTCSYTIVLCTIVLCTIVSTCGLRTGEANTPKVML